MALAASIATTQRLSTAATAATTLIALPNAGVPLIAAWVALSIFPSFAAAFSQIIVRLVAGALPARSQGTRLPFIS